MQTEPLDPNQILRELTIRSTVQQIETLASDYLRLRSAADRHVREAGSASMLVAGGMNGNGQPHMSAKEKHMLIAQQMSAQADGALAGMFGSVEFLKAMFSAPPLEPGLRISQ